MLTHALSFSLELMVPREGLAVAVVAGELDMYRAPVFETLLARSIDGGARHLVLDLGEVSFIDSTALNVIVGALLRLTEQQGSLNVLCGHSNVRRVFEVTGLDSVLGLHEVRHVVAP
jgi:anti-sigma B factor antagonist